MRTRVLTPPSRVSFFPFGRRGTGRYTGRDARLRCVRTPGGSEVDFAGYGQGVFAAIDVKNTRTVRSEDLRGLRAFREVRPEAKPVLLHRGRDRSVSDGVSLVPCGEFLRGVLPGAPPPGTA